MTSGDDYLLKSGEILARAEAESDPQARAELQSLARAYLRLASQAKRNTEFDVTYEPAPPKIDDPDVKP